MSLVTAPSSVGQVSNLSPLAEKRRPPRIKKRTSLLAHGQPMVWLNGGALAVCLAMILGLLALLHYQGLSTFWPVPAVEIHTVDGKRYLGEVVREETYRPEASVFDSLPASARAGAKSLVDSNGGVSTRRLLRTANFDLTQTHHHWVSDFEIKEESRPEWALVIERASNDGPFNGVPTAFLIDGKVEATEPADVLAKYHEYEGAVLDRVRQREKIKKDEGGAVSRKKEAARLAVRQAELDHGADSPQHQSAARQFAETGKWEEEETARLNRAISDLDKENDRYQMKLVTADGQEKTLPLAQIVRAYPANQLSFKDKLGIYCSRWWEFVSADPRNVNTEGGVFPAIWGTVAMTLLMSLAVVPFGVMASLYLREYAKAGVIISAVRIAVNNLAGVPSIVFGVFGLGFFCYGIGYYYDHAFEQARLPQSHIWNGRHHVGLSDPGAAHAARGHRRHRRSAGSRAGVDARGLLCLRRQQVANDLAHRAAACAAGHPDWYDPGDGPRRRRGGAAHARGSHEVGARFTGGQGSSLRPS